jgi:hypothetical protein
VCWMSKKPTTGVISGIERPADEVVWISCRGRASCQGKKAKILLKKDQGMQGRWIQYQCLTCKTPFSVTF